MEPALGRRLFLTAILLAAALTAVIAVAVSGVSRAGSFSTFVAVTGVAVVLVTFAEHLRRGA
jgi:hypothetical protein